MQLVPECFAKASALSCLPLAMNGVRVDNGGGFPSAVTVFVLVVSSTRPAHVLTFRQEDDWLVPRFEYAATPVDRTTRCVRDLQESLGGVPPLPPFTMIAELLPPESDSCSLFHNPDGATSVILLDAPAEFDVGSSLPAHARWTAASVVWESLTSMRHSFFYGYARQAMCLFLEPYSADAGPVAEDPRRSHRWAHKAVRYLMSVVCSRGASATADVRRETSESFSELFKVPTTAGWFYLKAPPPGWAEVASTAAVVELFPEDTLQVVGVCTDLNCFVAVGFRAVPSWDRTHQREAVRLLAAMHRKSARHVDVLRRAGVPDCSPDALAAKLDGWVAHAAVASALHTEGVAASLWRDTLSGACSRLAASPVPTALVHGDFTQNNVAIRGGGDVGGDRMILFDWGMSYLSHPFCDLILGPNVLQSWDGDVIAEYLLFWSSHVSGERAQQEMRAAEIVGWMARLDWGLQLLPLQHGMAHRTCLSYIESCTKLLARRARQVRAP